MAWDEFSVIARYFTRQLPQQSHALLGIGDDCALLAQPMDQQWAVSTDTLVENVHFLPTVAPADLGYKALAVNLSDLAAMGATPACFLLALTLPQISPDWLEAFSHGIFQLADRHGIHLIGGDTTKGPLSMTLTVLGTVAKGQALTRSAAKVGDDIYVTGTLGDSAAGFALLQAHLSTTDLEQYDYLVQRHLCPVPRITVGQRLLGLANAAIDLSDGLASDVLHILQASDCGAKIEVEDLPFSRAFSQIVPPSQYLTYALSGGEDYELCFTVPPERRAALQQALQNLGVHYTRIGKITDSTGQIEYYQKGKALTLSLQGFNHFPAPK